MLRSETDRKTRDERLGQLVKYCMISGALDLNLYQEYDVKRGLRESDGKGVLTGLTEISDVVAFKTVHGEKVPCPGELYFQGYNVMDLKNGFATRKFNYEEITYLLLFGALPNKTQLQEFIEILSQYRELPNKFVRDVIMKAPSMDIMNALQRSVLTLYSYDDNADDISIPNVLRQALSLIATMPLISVYAYHAYQHYHNDQSLVIRYPDPELSTAENILRILRSDGQYTELEARVLDIALVIHAEHGGANLKVENMFSDIKEHVHNWESEDEICDYLTKIINKEAFDRSGLIYGMGHAVYTLSDPRAVILCCVALFKHVAF